MKIKKFRATDSQTALRQIRQELGDDASIVGCYQVGEGVEYLVLDERSQENDTSTAVAKKLAAAEPEMNMRALQHEMGSMRQLLERHLRRLGSREVALADNTVAMNLLRQLELDEVLVTELAGRLPKGESEQHQTVLLDKLLTAELPVREFSASGAVAIVGAAGSGKTTLVAKLAAQAVMQGERDSIGLISLDNQRIAGGDMLRAVGRILRVPVLVANSTEELQQALLAFRGKTRIFIDTPSVNLREPEQLLQLQQRLQIIPGLEVLMALGADQDWRGSRALVNAFTTIDISGVTLTRSDLAFSLGGPLSFLFSHRIPLALIAEGAGITDGLRAADAIGLIAQARILTQTDVTDVVEQINIHAA